MTGVAIFISIAITTILVLALVKGIRDDTVVLMRRVLEGFFKWGVRHTLSPPEATRLIDWFECDLQDMLAQRGSGLGTCLIFIVVIWPRRWWHDRKTNTRTKT